MGNNKKENNSSDSDNQVRMRTKAANDIIFEQNAH